MFAHATGYSFWSKVMSLLLAGTLATALSQTPAYADNLSNNTLSLLSNNNLIIRDNIFYMPVDMTNNVAIELTTGTWGTIATTVFSIISTQMGREDSNNRFDEIDKQLKEISLKLSIVNEHLDHIDIALQRISDKNDEILGAVLDVPAKAALLKVIADISLIQDHWENWTKGLFIERSRMNAAYDQLTQDAAVLYNANDPSYTPAVAMSLRLSLDLAHKLKLNSSEIDDLKKGYRRFLAAALAPAPEIKPGDPITVNAMDSFPTRIAKRQARIKSYLGDQYKPRDLNLAFSGLAKTNCTQPVESVDPQDRQKAQIFSDASAKDSFIWDPPAAANVVLRLIHENAKGVIGGPVDPRVVIVFFGMNSNQETISETARIPATFDMTGSWDLVGALRVVENKFEYIGAYYRPSRLDFCGIGGPQLHHGEFGFLSSWGQPKSPEHFFSKYGVISDTEINLYQEKIVRANHELQLMAAEANEFAATAQLREALDRPAKARKFLIF